MKLEIKRKIINFFQAIKLKILKEKRIFVGMVGVDSGRIIIVDPSYRNEITEKMSYEEFGTKNYHQFKFKNNDIPLAIGVHAGFGDGMYAVYVHVKDIQNVVVPVVIKAEIIFIGDEYNE